MNTQTENVLCVYKDGALVAIVKRDESNGNKTVYVAAPASVDEIAHLINPKAVEV